MSVSELDNNLCADLYDVSEPLHETIKPEDLELWMISCWKHAGMICDIIPLTA